MHNRLKMLFTSAGRRVGLLQTFRADADLLGIALHITACDIDPRWSSACLLADSSFRSSPSDDPHFADQILAYSKSTGITLVVPTNDRDLLPLAIARSRFEAEGIHVVISDLSFVEATTDKLRTFQVFQRLDIPTPKTWSLLEGKDCIEFGPSEFIAKPRYGSAGKGFTHLRDRAALQHLDPREDWILQERLFGSEYTVNILINSKRTIEAVVPHRRRSVRAGEVEKGNTERDTHINRIIEKLFNSLHGAVGPVCVQMFRIAPEEFAVIEINARFGGGYPLCHAAGSRFGSWLIAEHLNLERPDLGQWVDGLAMVRYDTAVYLPMTDKQ